MLRFENISLKKVVAWDLRSTSLNIATRNEMFLLSWILKKLKNNTGLGNHYIQEAALSSAFWALVVSHSVLTAGRYLWKEGSSYRRAVTCNTCQELKCSFGNGHAVSVSFSSSLLLNFGAFYFWNPCDRVWCHPTWAIFSRKLLFDTLSAV